MKTRYLTIVCAGLVCSFIACNREMNEADLPFPSGEFTVVASFGDMQNTRTAIVNETEVWWTPNDAINVFYGSLTSGRFTSTVAEAAATAAFTGSLPAITGTIETGGEAQPFWAVYPYNVQNICDGSSITLTVPVKQKGEEGTFGRNTFPAIATSSGLDLAFYNVCGGIVLTVNRDDIRTITLRGKNNETLAGTVRVAFVEDSPAVLEVVQGEQAISFRSPGNKPFVPGSRYFITVLPVTFSQGFTLTFVTENGEVGTKEVSDAKTINRSRFLVVNNADADVSFAPDQTHSNLIHFSDDDLKDALVAAFDTDSDGELSYDEAAAVTSPTDIKAAFGNNKVFTSFNEFQYFTGITSITANMFQDWTRLESIELPESIKSIGNNAFQNCYSLASLVIPESVESLSDYSFSGCTNLASFVMPYGIKIIPYAAFEGCTSLTEFVIPSSVTTIGFYAFSGCSNLASVTIPKSVTTLQNAAFWDCKSISYIYIEDLQYFINLGQGARPTSYTQRSAHIFVSGEEITSVSFEDGISIIPAGAIMNCGYITKVYIPDGVTKIDQHAFANCRGLTSVVLPNGLTSIGDSAFSYCTGLTSVVLPDGLTSIGNSAFDTDVALTSFEFPASIKTIGTAALRGCSSLASITVKAVDVPKGGQYMFSSNDCPIYVPEESVDAYKSAPWWNLFSSRIMPIMAEGDDASVSDNVTARYLGGSMSIVNGLIQSNSKLNYGVYNNSDKSIDVLTIQLLDGETGAVGNMMSVNSTINPGANQAWTITIGAAGIHSPTAIFVYRCEGKRYEIRVPYPN